jgi:hypothetical protein
MASEKKKRKEAKLRKETQGLAKRGPVHRDGDRRRRPLGLTVRDAIAAKRELQGLTPESSIEASDLAEDLDDEENEKLPPDYDPLD